MAAVRNATALPPGAFTALVLFISERAHPFHISGVTAQASAPPARR